MVYCNQVYGWVRLSINRIIYHFYHIASGPGKKKKSNSGLFECQFHEIEVSANTVCDGSASFKYNEGKLLATDSKNY